MKELPRTVTMLIDTREKTPFAFPDIIAVEWGGKDYPVTVRSERAKLDCGDYTLKSYEHIAALERKSSLDGELSDNITTADRARFVRALSRLAGSCLYPYLMLESGGGAWWTEGKTNSDAGMTMDHLGQLVSQLRLNLIFNASRPTTVHAKRRMGEFVLRLMIGHMLVLSNEGKELTNVRTPDQPQRARNCPSRYGGKPVDPKPLASGNS